MCTGGLWLPFWVSMCLVGQISNLEGLLVWRRDINFFTGSYTLYTYMMKQRRSVLRKLKEQNEQASK